MDALWKCIDRNYTNVTAAAALCLCQCSTSLSATTKHDSNRAIAVVAATGGKSHSCGLLFVQMVLQMVTQKCDGIHYLESLVCVQVKGHSGVWEEEV